MPGIARITDRTHGTCYCHDSPITIGGMIITGDPNVYANNLNVARIGDIVLADCGHTGIIVTGSDSVFSSNIPHARLGDSTTGCYVAIIVTCSPDTYAG